MANQRGTYIFFGTGIISVSGAPLYYVRKKQYLEQQGWIVRIFTFVEGNAALPDLESYEDGIMSELKFPPVFYTQAHREKIIANIVSHLPDSEQYVIESNRPLIAPWAELLAERLQAKHILFCLDETPHGYSEDFLNFIWFKYHRGEVATIYRAIIRTLLGRKRADTSVDPARLSVSPTGATNLVQDIPFDTSSIPYGRINVLSIGRLDKPYVLPIMQELAAYAVANADLQFNLLILGKNDATEQQLTQLFKAVSNVNLLYFGELHPIPENLMKCVDVAIATAGSAALCRKFSICTISVDTTDFRPIGILGYNAQSHSFRLRREPSVPLADLMNLILRDKVVVSHYERPVGFGMEEDYTSHFNFIEQSSSSKEYYHFTQTIKDKIITVVGAIIGLENCNRLFKLIQKRTVKQN